MKTIAIIVSVFLLSGCSMLRGKIDENMRQILSSDIPIECKVGYLQGVHVGESANLKLQAQLLALKNLGIDEQSKEYKSCYSEGIQTNMLGTKAHNLIMRCINGICSLGVK